MKNKLSIAHIVLQLLGIICFNLLCKLNEIPLNSINFLLVTAIIILFYIAGGIRIITKLL